MAILTGRDGEVLWDPAGATATVKIASLNAWKASFKTDFEEVTCYGDTGKVFVPGLPDRSGTLGGFWDSSETALFEAADGATKGMLKLVPHKAEASFFWSGLAYLDADIDCSLQAPKVTGTWKAAGPWTFANTLAA